MKITKNLQYYKFCSYGFLKNLKFFEPFILLFFLEKGLIFLEIGTLYTIREITRNILEIPAGIIADALGRRRTMIIAFATYIISFLIYHISTGFGLLIFATLIFAVGDAFRTGTHKAMIFEYLRLHDWTDQKVYYYGHTRSWSQFGSAVSSLIAAALVFYSGSYSLIFLFSAAPYFLGLLLILTYPKDLDGEVFSVSSEKIRFRFKKVLNEFWVSFKNPGTLKAIINLSSYSGYFRAVKDYLQPVINTLAIGMPVFLSLKEDQRSAILIGIIYFFIYLTTSATARRSGRFSEKFSFLTVPLNLTLIIGLLTGIATGLFYHIELLILSIVFFLGIYLIENLRLPVGIAYVTENLKEDILATALSAESQSKTIFAAILSLVLGWCADKFGVGTGLIVISVILLLPVPFYLVRRKIRAQSRAEKSSVLIPPA